MSTAHALHRASPVATVRPLRAGDAAALRAFVCGLPAAAKRQRFHGAINGCSDTLLARLMAVDGERQVAFVAVQANDDGERIVGEARYAVARDGVRAEFAIAVAEAQQGHGAAQRLMRALLDHARAAGLSALDGEVLDGNARMQAFMQRQGFGIDALADTEPGVQRWTRRLDEEPAAEGARPLQTLRTWWQLAFGNPFA